MITVLAHSSFMTRRDLRWLSRLPWLMAITLVQPVVWLLLFGQLFQKTVDIPGFAGNSYIDFLTPGVVVMTALFSGGWLGMGVINDLDRGVMDRFLVSPVHRGSLIVGRLVYQATVTVIQSLVVVGLGLLVGAGFPGGLVGILVLIVSAVLVGAAFGSLSNGLALLVRREEPLIATANLALLPISFLSGTFMQQSLMPGWMHRLVRYNPVNWAVEAGREALGADVNWTFVSSRAAALLVLALGCAWLSTRGFRAYQRSI